MVGFGGLDPEIGMHHPLRRRVKGLLELEDGLQLMVFKDLDVAIGMVSGVVF